jgi:membrane protease subunit HflC
VKRALLLLAAVLVLAFVVRTGFFVVERGEAAIVTRFGEPTRVVERPGLYTKAPLPVQSVMRFDTRLRVWESGPRECATADSSAVVLSVYAAWRIGDVRTFAETCGTPERAESRLSDALLSELARAVAGRPASAFASAQPTDVRTPEVLHAVRAGSRERLAKLGIEVADLGVTGLTLPDAARAAVIGRMAAERSAAAALEVAAGQEEAARIRAAADSERQVILASARREAERIRDEADAAAAAVYAEAHAADPQFYRFIRTLESYREFMDGRTTVVLSSDSELLDLLEEETQ